MRKWLVLLVILALMIAATGCLWGSMESGRVEPFYSVWGVNPSDVFAVGGFVYPYVSHYDGTEWGNMTLPEMPVWSGFRGVWGSASDDVFAVGYVQPDSKGIVYHYDGNAWTPMDGPINGDHPRLLKAVWGTGPDNVFAVGGDKERGPIIEHYDGSTWTIMFHLPGGWAPWGLNAVWGDVHDDMIEVFVVGDKGIVYHYDGNEWDAMYGGTNVDLLGVHGVHWARVFAVGEDGTIVHYNSVNWSQVTSGTTKTLFGVSDYWAVGEGGTILHRESGYTEWEPYLSATRSNLYGVWDEFDSSYAYAVGGCGTILDFPHSLTTSTSESTEMRLESSGLIASNEILSADVVNLGDHVTISLNVDVASPPLTVEDMLPDELSYIPNTLVVSGGPATCETSEHHIVCVLTGTGSYDITFDVQVTHASGFIGDYLEWYNSGFTTDDLEGEDITVENTVKVGDEESTETLTIKPFDGFLKLYNNAWYPGEDGDTYLGDPLTVPINKDVHWEVLLAVCNWSGDDIGDMTSIQIKDKLGKGLELNDMGMATCVGGEWSFDYETDPSTLSRGTGQIHLTGKEVPDLTDNDVALAGLEISTDKNPGAGKGKGAVGRQEFADTVLTEHELNSGAELKFTDPETGLKLTAVAPAIVVTADPNWAQE